MRRVRSVAFGTRAAFSRGTRALGVLLLTAGIVGAPCLSGAVPLNDEETIRVSLRAYGNVRIGTNAKQSTRLERPGSFGGTFVYTPAWKVIQNR